MTDKRFKIKEIEIDDYNVECADAKLVITDNDEVLLNTDAVDLLNKLNDENQELKRFIEELEQTYEEKSKRCWMEDSE